MAVTTDSLKNNVTTDTTVTTSNHNSDVKNDNSGTHAPITLSDVAAEYIKIHVEKAKNKGAIAMRLAVVKGGCSGKQYSFELATSLDENTDLVFAKNGAQVIINKEDFATFAGLEIDFETEGLNKYVVFRNPNAKHSCGCGKSFS